MSAHGSCWLKNNFILLGSPLESATAHSDYICSCAILNDLYVAIFFLNWIHLLDLKVHVPNLKNSSIDQLSPPPTEPALLIPRMPSSCHELASSQW